MVRGALRDGGFAGGSIRPSGPGMQTRCRSFPVAWPPGTTIGTNLGDPLLPYIPRLVLDWLENHDAESRRSIDGSTLFADISGFTQLTERLAQQGKAGAEEMGDILNSVFDELLAPAYQHQGGLVKWGGDAVLLIFDGPDHGARAAAAAWEMQKVIRQVGKLKTSGGAVRLGMSIGVHTGPIDVLLVGSVHRELIVTGPSATAVAQMEKVADAGDVVVSRSTAEAVRRRGGRIGARKGGGWLLDKPPYVPVLGIRAAKAGPEVDVSVSLTPDLRHHLLDGVVDHEHRHIAVGFIEVAGTDELAVASDERALTDAVEQVVSRAQEAAAANDVTLLSTDVNADGFKVILTAGAPRRVGDDEGRIVAALLAVVSEPSPLRLRAGANAGRVFAGDFGPFYRRVYSVAGDCVNLAARLMGAAGEGELLVSDVALGRTNGQFVSEPVPPFHVKGKAEPVVAHRVKGRVTTRTQSAETTPLVGRETELATLLTALREAQEGRGQTVDLVGPAGIGKSRLLQELTQVSGCPILWVDGDIYGQATPYKPIRRFVREQLGLPFDAAPQAVAYGFRDLIADAAPHMVEWLPLMGYVIDAPFEMTDVVADLDVETRKERMEWSISQLLGALITEPSILVFNDAHYMDEATVDLMRRINSDAAERPWLVVTSYRPDDRAVVAPGSTVLELHPLDGAAADELLSTLTESSTLPLHRLRELAERAGGNPLFLQELAASAAVEGLDELPDTIEEIISARIDRLSPTRRRLLRAAAVLGMIVDRDLLGPMLVEVENASADVLDDLGHLSEFVEPIDGRQLKFRHHLVREAAYEGLPFRRRSRLHASAADALEREASDSRVDLLSLHALAGGRYETAWRASVVAGDRARDQYACAEAAECYRRALKAWDHLSERPVEITAVAEALGDQCYQLGDFPGAEAAYRRAIRTGTVEPVTEALIRDKIALMRRDTGQFSAAVRWITSAQRALDGVEGRAAEHARGRVLVTRARVRYLQGRKREAYRNAAEALLVAEAVGDADTTATALEYMDATEFTMGGTPNSERSERALAIYREIGDLSGQARMHNSLGALAYFRGDWVEAIGHYSSAATAYRRSGREWIAALSDANVAEVLSDQGHLDHAGEILSASLRVFQGVGADGDMAFAGYMLGRIAARQGRFDEARERFVAARDHFSETGVADEVVLIDAYRAECELLAGQPDAALLLAESALVAARRLDGTPAIPLLHRVRGLALDLHGSHQEADEELRLSLAHARERGAMHEVALALDTLVRTGRSQGAAERDDWITERDDLQTRLGMVLADHP